MSDGRWACDVLCDSANNTSSSVLKTLEVLICGVNLSSQPPIDPKKPSIARLTFELHGVTPPKALKMRWMTISSAHSGV